MTNEKNRTHLQMIQTKTVSDVGICIFKFVLFYLFLILFMNNTTAYNSSLLLITLSYTPNINMTVDRIRNNINYNNIVA